MTTHIFIVNEKTFKIHLEYMFAGTGASRNADDDIDFNDNKKSYLHYSVENKLVGMMADCSRVRVDDFVIFYVQATKSKEGKFYGIFKIAGKPFLESKGEYLRKELDKPLFFRVMIKPYKVYQSGITEWQALDEITGISAPCQMLWSLIYRKLKGNRGNTMITKYEAERLFTLIMKENNWISLDSSFYSYDETISKIIPINEECSYTGKSIPFNIEKRLQEKYVSNQAFEVHLQMYIAQHLGTGYNKSLDKALDLVDHNVEWIGNEVSCGVGMQRIDIMCSYEVDDSERIVVPIELKAVGPSIDNIRQIKRYVEWIEQYYLPNRPSVIQPVLICKSVKERINKVKSSFKEFNDSAEGRYLPLKYIEYKIEEGRLMFDQIKY